MSREKWGDFISQCCSHVIAQLSSFLLVLLLKYMHGQISHKVSLASLQMFVLLQFLLIVQLIYVFNLFFCHENVFFIIFLVFIIFIENTKIVLSMNFELRLEIMIINRIINSFIILTFLLKQYLLVNIHYIIFADYLKLLKLLISHFLGFY